MYRIPMERRLKVWNRNRSEETYHPPEPEIRTVIRHGRLAGTNVS